MREQRVDLERADEAAANARLRTVARDLLVAEKTSPRKIWPTSGCSMPVIRLIRVVLPAPFGPISA
jgi:hypothetical protein